MNIHGFLAVGFLLRRGRFHLGPATAARAFPSTGSHRGTRGGMPYSIILKIDRRVHVAVVLRPAPIAGSRAVARDVMNMGISKGAFQNVRKN